MSLPITVTALMTGITANMLRSMQPAARQRLRDQCVRIYREIEGSNITAHTARAKAPRFGILADPHMKDTD